MWKRRELLMISVATAALATTGGVLAMPQVVEGTSMGLIGHGVEHFCDVLTGCMPLEQVALVALRGADYQRYVVQGEVPDYVVQFTRFPASWDYPDPAVVLAEMVASHKVLTYPKDQPPQPRTSYLEHIVRWEEAVLAHCQRQEGFSV